MANTDRQDRHARLTAIVETTRSLVWSVGPERFQILAFNDSLAEYWKQGRFHFDIRVGMLPEDFPVGGQASHWRALYSRALREGSFVTEYESASQPITLLLSLTRMERDGKPIGISAVASDVTALRALRDRLQRDNVALRQEVSIHMGPTAMLGESPAMARVLEEARTVATADAAVLITGETGTGKGLLARAIHEMSPRAGRPMVAVNCAALPAGLIESELFGREKGAFTGAWTREKGRFEAADGSTVFLDEVADLPLGLQAKLLGVLQDGRFQRLGSAQTVRVDVRVIAATNRDLAAMVADGRFRADLFYRLSVFPIAMPPLRARPEDVPMLVWDAVRFFSRKLGKTIDSIPREAMRQLQEHPWPGNVRELRNLVERSVILSRGRTLSLAFDSDEPPPAAAVTLEDAQRRHVLAALERTNWRIGGDGGAAERLGVQRSTLNSLMKRLGISRPRR